MHHLIGVVVVEGHGVVRVGPFVLDSPDRREELAWGGQEYVRLSQQREGLYSHKCHWRNLQPCAPLQQWGSRSAANLPSCHGDRWHKNRRLGCHLRRQRRQRRHELQPSLSAATEPTMALFDNPYQRFCGLEAGLSRVQLEALCGKRRQGCGDASPCARVSATILDRRLHETGPLKAQGGKACLASEHAGRTARFVSNANPGRSDRCASHLFNAHRCSAIGRCLRGSFGCKASCCSQSPLLLGTPRCRHSCKIESCQALAQQRHQQQRLRHPPCALGGGSKVRHYGNPAEACLQGDALMPRLHTCM